MFLLTGRFRSVSCLLAAWCSLWLAAATAYAEGQESAFAAPQSAVLSTDVLGPGLFGDGFNNNGGDSTVELVRFIANSAASPLNIDYNQAGDTIDFSAFVTTGGTAGSLGSDIHGRGSVLFLPGDGETIAMNNGGIGLGAHANWLITFDLDDIRQTEFGQTGTDLQLTGRFGQNGQGSPGETVTSGEVQGNIYLDGALIDSSPLQTINDPSHLFDLLLPSDGRFLTFAILNGQGSGTTFDDGTFRDLLLTELPPPEIPEPSTLVLMVTAVVGLAAHRYRRRRAG